MKVGLFGFAGGVSVCLCVTAVFLLPVTLWNAPRIPLISNTSLVQQDLGRRGAHWNRVFRFILPPIRREIQAEHIGQRPRVSSNKQSAATASSRHPVCFGSACNWWRVASCSTRSGCSTTSGSPAGGIGTSTAAAECCGGASGSGRAEEGSVDAGRDGADDSSDQEHQGS